MSRYSTNFKCDTGTRSIGYIIFIKRLRLENYKMISSDPRMVVLPRQD